MITLRKIFAWGRRMSDGTGKLILAMIGSIALSAAGVVYAVFGGVAADGGRGGALAVALTFFMLFMGRGTPEAALEVEIPERGRRAAGGGRLRGSRQARDRVGPGPQRRCIDAGLAGKGEGLPHHRQRRRHDRLGLRRSLSRMVWRPDAVAAARPQSQFRSTPICFDARGRGAHRPVFASA